MSDDDLARTALVETTHADDAAAATVAGAIAPDNTAEIRTTADGATVRTRVERGTTGGLLATVDDYLVNLDVADDVAATGRATRDDGPTAATDAIAGGDTTDAAGSRDSPDSRDTATDADADDANTEDADDVDDADADDVDDADADDTHHT